jgi:hypothetical protein
MHLKMWFSFDGISGELSPGFSSLATAFPCHFLGTAISSRLRVGSNRADELPGCHENNLVHSEGFQVYKNAHLGGQNGNHWNRSCPRTAVLN